MKFKPIIRVSRHNHNPNLDILMKVQRRLCFYCEEFMMEATKDHFIPKSFRTTLAGNMVYACQKCNNKKGCKMPTTAEILKAVDLWSKCAAEPSNNYHKAEPVIVLVRGKPRFKLIMSAEDIHDWTL